ncbi:MAG: aldo/keto reductase [Myxococcales bacterium]|nr:aldo/keto reductase [Myxococcales bacterium]
MRTRTLGRTAIEVSEIGLGCWGLSGEAYGEVSREQARATIDAALDEGCTVLELASCYGEKGREVDTILGEALEGRDRSKVRIVLRIGIDRESSPPRKRFDRGSLMRMLESSLARLRTNYVDVVLLHNPLASTLERSFDALDALASFRERGMATAMGVSAGSFDAASAALKQSIDVIELPYNILAPRLLHALLPEITRAQVGIIARSPLAYGLLADGFDAERQFAQGDHRLDRWTPEDIGRRVRQREVLRPFVKDSVKSLREAAIRYVLANHTVGCTVVGARTPEMARENARAAEDLPYLDPAVFSTLGQRLEEEGISS